MYLGHGHDLSVSFTNFCFPNRTVVQFLLPKRKIVSAPIPVTFIVRCVWVCSGYWTFDYLRGCKGAPSPNRTCACEETADGKIECECRGDFCNGAIGGWSTECSEPDEIYLIGAAMIVDMVVLITGVVASRLLI